MSAIEPHFYRNLCLALAHPEWEALQYAENSVQEGIRAEMARIFMTRTRDEWFEALKDKEVCISPVLSVAEAAESENVAARGLLMPHIHPDAGDVRLMRSPIRMSEAPGAIQRPSPRLGEHSRDILEAMGYQQSKIDELVNKGIVKVGGPPQRPTA